MFTQTHMFLFAAFSLLHSVLRFRSLPVIYSAGLSFPPRSATLSSPRLLVYVAPSLYHTCVRPCIRAPHLRPSSSSPCAHISVLYRNVKVKECFAAQGVFKICNPVEMQPCGNFHCWGYVTNGGWYNPPREVLTPLGGVDNSLESCDWFGCSIICQFVLAFVNEDYQVIVEIECIYFLYCYNKVYGNVKYCYYFV